MNKHVGVERQAGHVDDGVGDALDIHHRLGGDRTVGLRHADRHWLRHLGQRIADVDLAASDVVGPAVERQRLGHPGDGVLGRRVGHRARTRRIGRHRAVVDDAAAHRLLPAHGAEGGAGAQERAGEVDADDIVPDLDRDLVDRRRLVAHAGIVEEQVDAAEGFDHRFEQIVDLIGLADVAGNRQRLGLGLAGLGDRFLQHRFAASAEHRVPAVPEQRRGDALADACAGAGNDGGFLCHGSHRCPPVIAATWHRK